MKLYNTLTRNIETFKPQKDGEVKLYTCGPTVYDYAHIGNLRNAVFNDTLRRALEASDYKVKHVMNITDVGHLVSDADNGEDKLEKGAQREGKTVWDVAAFYTKAYQEDIASINNLLPNGYTSPKHHDPYARATEFIDEQIAMVQALFDKGFAYQTKQAIYFDVQKLKNYGELTGQRLAEKEVGVRREVVTDEDKHSPHDFAVWFFAVGHFQDHAMQWDSPWGSGFPGWHLECSAIIHKTLGDPIDIHTGGIDLIGTHHPNEMAQTEAAFGHPLAHYWIHNEFVLIDGTKMAKSKGNFYNLHDLLDKEYTGLDFRMLALQAHYRTELNFSWDNLQAAHQRLVAYQQMADQRWQPSPHGISKEDLDKIQASMLVALQNDLNTPEVLALLSKLSTAIETKGINTDFEPFLKFVDSTLGLKLSERPDIPEEGKAVLAQRETARHNKDWAEADKIRDNLLLNGIEVRDTDLGQRWVRV